jgi:prepilin-type processing-associated H-X9-DG protein
MVLVLVVPSGLFMAFYAVAGPIAGVGLGTLSMATAVCLVLAVQNARARRFQVHPGGVQVAFADASVRFISEDIDSGDESQASPRSHQVGDDPSPTPYGVWGALGTAASSDYVGEY